MFYRKIYTFIHIFNSLKFGSISLFRKIFFSVREKSLYFFMLALRSNLICDENSKSLIEFKIFPKYPKRMYPLQPNIKELSIVIHGQIIDKEFIQESINWYRSCGVKNIIVSTRDNVDNFYNSKTIKIKSNEFKEIFDEHNDVLEISAALKYVPKNNLILKTKSHQRIFNELAISALPFIHKSHNSKLTKSGKRLGVLSTNSKISQINLISDLLYIGTFDEISSIYSTKLLSRGTKKYKAYKNQDILKKESNKNNLFMNHFFVDIYPEQIFFNSYRENCLNQDMRENKISTKSDYLNSLATYLDIISECLYVLDPEELDIISLNLNKNPKVDFNHMQNYERNLKPLLNLTRLNWLSLNCDKDYKNEILSFISKKIKSK